MVWLFAQPSDDVRELNHLFVIATLQRCVSKRVIVSWSKLNESTMLVRTGGTADVVVISGLFMWLQVNRRNQMRMQTTSISTKLFPLKIPTNTGRIIPAFRMVEALPLFHVLSMRQDKTIYVVMKSTKVQSSKTRLPRRCNRRKNPFN